MTRRMLVCCAVLIASFAIPGAVFAHHGNAAYDEAKTVTLKGTITSFDFINPHVQVYFDIKDDHGNVVHWACETMSPGKLTRGGWTHDMLKPGEQVTITAAPAKNGRPVGLLRKIVLADGTVLTPNETPY